MNIVITIILLLATTLLSSCASVSYDESDSTAANILRTGCYLTNTEAGIYQNPVSDKLSGSKGNFLIQTGLPTNEWQYTSYGDSWVKVADVPVGTRLRVTQVFNQSWGAQGRYWLVYGKLLDNRLPAEEFVIPSGNYAKTGQLWITPISPDADNTPIRFREYFVRPCN